jgi:hypothetical protein
VTSHHSDVPADLRKALDSFSSTGARPEFKASLRDQFMSGGAAATVFTSQDELDMEARLEQSVVPKAHSAFRESLRNEFLSAGGVNVEPVAARRSRRFGSAPIYSALIAAAALVLFFVSPWNSTAPEWTSVGSTGSSDYVIDGQQVQYTDSASFTDSFDRGDCSFKIGKESLSVVQVGVGVMLEFPPGTEFKLPPNVEAASGPLEIRLLTGGLRVSTTPDFTRPVLVHTPDTTITLAGHSLGVDILAEGTCLCIESGDAQMIPTGGDRTPVSVSKNTSTFIKHDGSAVLYKSVHHKAEMTNFDKRTKKFLY